MKEFLRKVREPKAKPSTGLKVFRTVLIVLLGIGIGVLQKWLDSTDISELPRIVETLDIVNFFGRLGIWILLGVVIAVHASTPLRASINTSLFFLGMLGGYYLYCQFALGFLPVRYMIVWIVIAIATLVIAYGVWYSVGYGPVSIVLSAIILGVSFSQAFLITQGFQVTHLLEVLCWVIMLVVLRRTPKEFIIQFVLSIGVAVLYQLFIPYWG